MEFWHSISQTGIDANSSWHRNMQIILCNRIAAILSLLTLLVSSVAIAFFGLSISVGLAFSTAIIFLIPILLNQWKFHNGSRLFLTISLSVSAIVISILDKNLFIQLEEFQYFIFRLMLLMAGLFPFVVFRLDEQKYWVPAFILNIVCIIFYDPVHELFGVGYFQLGLTGPNYYFTNYVTIAAALVIGGSTYFLKYSFEETEKTNESLIKNLNQANLVIYQQQKKVTEENVQLSQNLKEKNIQLVEANKELIRHNSELQQYSYTVSHNLRGPVASLGGLINLLNQQNQSIENHELLVHMEKSLLVLEGTIQDLSHIIDIRNNLSQIRQKIVLSDELMQTKSLLEKEIKDHQVFIETDFTGSPEIYAVKHMLDSILYNLISNAIKYRSPDRKPHIKISSINSDNRIRLTLEDNGLGIDLEKYAGKLFGLYKRFHTHTDGRGLGLYLVKLQTESMGGVITVQSKLGVGTTFTITLPVPETLREQILMDNSSARLYFDASLHAVCMVWKNEISVQEYNEFLTKAADFVKTFRTPNWISNLPELKDRDEERLNAARIRIRSQLVHDGLRRIAVIMPKANYPDYEQRTRIMRNAYDAELQFFETMDEAKSWVTEQNRLS
ncbi:MAG: HAMP domain-containing histidine kinase [Bacteroidia bacterium]|nr:HAMP domain-containing histidine kinase [Bacteroidia bacterium]